MKTIQHLEHRGRANRWGFTMLELLVAISIIGLVLAVAVPSSVQFYQSMQYRQAVRDVVTTLASARYRAINSGQAQDVAVDPVAKVIALNGENNWFFCCAPSWTSNATRRNTAIDPQFFSATNGHFFYNFFANCSIFFKCFLANIS